MKNTRNTVDSSSQITIYETEDGKACISDTISSMSQTPTLEKQEYLQKHVGHLYFGVPWKECDSKLRPPYRLWTRKNGFFNFDETDFGKWRDATVSIR